MRSLWFLEAQEDSEVKSMGGLGVGHGACLLSWNLLSTAWCSRFPGQPTPQRSGMHLVRIVGENEMTWLVHLVFSGAKEKLGKTTQPAEWRGWRALNCPSGRSLQSGSQKLEGSTREMCDWEDKPLPHLFIRLFNHYLSNPCYPCFVHCCSLSTYKGYSHEQSPGLPGAYILVGKTEKQSINQIIFCWMYQCFMEKKQEHRRQRVAGAEEVAI